ncbi:MAG: hypothetical protein NTV30_09185, partial [Chloroflexi bacterium]|nr:hypothetical protein [Chloroflexota bacterium]
LDVFEENVMIYQWDYFVAFKKMGIKGKLKLEDYLKLAGEINPGGNIEMFLQGRASYKLKSFYKVYPASAFINRPCFPEFLRNWHNHFDNYGNIMPGFCGGISLGQISELDTLITGGIELNDRPVLKYIINQDFAGLIKYACDSGYKEQPDGYISKCHLCLDIRRHLARTGNFIELKPEQFYTHLDLELIKDL